MTANDPEPHIAQTAQATLERGDPAALDLFDRAINADPGNARLWIGKAHALDLNGDRRGARIVAQQLADQAPSLLEAQALLAQLRLSDGEQDFASHYSAAAARHPRNPNILAAHCQILAGLDLAYEALEVAAEARERFPDEPHFAFLEAVQAGSSGDWERAEAIYAALDYDAPVRDLQEARHRVRGGQFDQADALLEKSLVADPWDIAAWALRGIVWRVTEDPRAQWLHEQDDLIQFRSLSARDGLIGDATSELAELHKTATMPLGQSLRGGTQTRGILFKRTQPILAELHEAILATLEEYRAELAAADPTHPLLRHRDAPWQLAGSWSVRLSGGSDHHTAHIHPQGIVSSALYLVVPDSAKSDERQGWLEIGGPPSDLGLEVSPLWSIKPEPGKLVLFPSTLYHGTRPFEGSERLTVAFDVTVSA